MTSTCLKAILLTSLYVLVRNQYDYGTSGNSQVNTDSGYSSSLGSSDTGKTDNINFPLQQDLDNLRKEESREAFINFQPAPESNCVEEDTASACITKPNCCFISTGYYSYDLTACVDILDESNQRAFCSNLQSETDRMGYYVTSCLCKDFRFSGSHLLGTSMVMFLGFLMI